MKMARSNKNECLTGRCRTVTEPLSKFSYLRYPFSQSFASVVFAVSLTQTADL